MASLYAQSDPSFLRFNPLTLLAQVSGQKTNGCLMIYSGSKSWRLYLEEGELVYASAAEAAFDRLERHLRQMGRVVPSLVSAVRVQVRLLFETRQSIPSALSPDYQAIQWLVEQQYLTPLQAAGLVENLAKESIRSLLSVSTGSYDIVDRAQLEDWFSVCRLNLRSIIQTTEDATSKAEMPRLGLLNGGSSSLAGKAEQPLSSAHLQPEQMLQPEQNFKPEQPFKPEQNFNTGQPFKADPLQSTASASRPFQPGAFSPGPTQRSIQTSQRTPPQSSGSASSTAASSRTERYRVVCVDDSPSILKLIHSYLEEDDFSVFMINDPVRALMQVVRCKPDLVLLDVEMPNLDGYELCSLLRRHPAFKSIPIIMVTGNTGFVDRARAKLVGASGYLTKPFNRSELLKIVFRNLPV